MRWISFPELREIFDLVFIDADKPQYISYYNAVFDKLQGWGSHPG